MRTEQVEAREPAKTRNLLIPVDDHEGRVRPLREESTRRVQHTHGRRMKPHKRRDQGAAAERRTAMVK